VSELLQGKFEELSRRYPANMRSSLVLPLLHFVQEQKGCVTKEDAATIAECTGVPGIQVTEALTWYTMFRREPAGRHVVKVCRNIACSLRGADRIVDYLRQRLRIEVGETSADGRFTLLTVECLASCGTAPAMQIGDTYYENLDEAALDRILSGLA
jgi:NADH-quinone oxidoreductase subunit E